MAQATTPTLGSSPSAIAPERLAWGILLLAFGVFCFMCAVTSIGLYYFFFESPLPMQTVLTVGRNTVRVVPANAAEQAEVYQREISSRTLVRTDPTEFRSQSVLSFYDPSEGQPIATVTMKSGTDLFFQHANRPRFTWSNTDYRIEIDDLRGEAEILVHDDLPRDLVLIAHTVHDVEVRIQTSGTYLIETTATEVNVTNRDGQAILVEPSHQSGSLIPAGFVETYDVETDTLSRHEDRIDLLENGELKPANDNDLIQVAGWECFNDPVDRLPYGEFQFDRIPQKETALRLVRGDNADNSSKTLCTQTLVESEFGLDVSGYDYLQIEATVYINYQSLSRCGELATECPLMFRLTYFSDGFLNEWVHGVYARNDAGINYPLRCDSCWENHVLINEKVLYTYESGNLFEVIPIEALRPDSIVSLSFWAEGHQYDVYVQDIALYAGNLADT